MKYLVNFVRHLPFGGLWDVLEWEKKNELGSPLNEDTSTDQKDTFCIPNYRVCVLSNPWNQDTSQIR